MGKAWDVGDGSGPDAPRDAAADAELAAMQRFAAHAPMVPRLARLVLGRYCAYDQHDDLVQAGHLALLLAARRWQDRGLPFAAYAVTRVRGAMLDHLRAARPRGLGRGGPSIAQVSIDSIATDQDIRFAAPTDPVDQLLIEAQGAAALAHAITRLPPREALVLQLYFVEQLSLQDIGGMLGVGAARICQIKKQGLDRLAEQLDRSLLG